MSNDYTTNRQHEYAANPGSELVGSQREAANRFAQIPPFATVFMQAVVREVFYDPAILDDDRIDELISKYGVTQTTYLRRLPHHAVLAELVRDGTTPQQPPQIFFPFFPPHLTLPVKAGERVWVMKEQNKIAEYGFWFCRVTEPRDIDDINITHADRRHDLVTKKGEPPTFHNGAFVDAKNGPQNDASTASIVGGEKEYETIIQDSDSGKLVDFEAVPRFTARPGDHAIQGSNNTLISLGTDRISAAAETEVDAAAKNRKGKRAKGKPKDDVRLGSGTIDIVVGRGQEKSKSKLKKIQNSLKNDELEKREDSEKEGDPDFEFDLSRIYVSMKTAADDNFKIKTKTIKPVLKKGAEAPAIIAKSDHIRLIAREEMRMIVQPKMDSPEGDCAAIVIKKNSVGGVDIIFVPSDKGLIKLGGDDADQAILVSPVTPPPAPGTVNCPPLVTTMGGIFGNGGAHGTFARKVLAK